MEPISKLIRTRQAMGIKDCMLAKWYMGKIRLKIDVQHSYEQYHKLILNHIKKVLQNELESTPHLSKNIQSTNDAPIWTFWWQGEKDMPKIIRLNYQSMKEHSGGHPVRLLTKDNYREFINVPTEIIQLVEKKIISIAQLCDYIRFKLLDEYGGLWLDGTIRVFEDIPERIFQQPIYSFKGQTIDNHLISNFDWIIGIFGAQKGNKLTGYIADLLFAYLTKKQILIDYFLTDYIIWIVRDLSKDMAQALEGLQYEHTNIFYLAQNQDKILDKAEFLQARKNTSLFYCTYKIKGDCPSALKYFEEHLYE